jgi:hypothetical protein
MAVRLDALQHRALPNTSPLLLPTWPATENGEEDRTVERYRDLQRARASLRAYENHINV